VGQQEIAEILKKQYPKYPDYTEVMEITGLPRNQVMKNLVRLSKRECEIKITKTVYSWRTGYRIKPEDENI